jgi:AraC-like DNA-binding protein
VEAEQEVLLVLVRYGARGLARRLGISPRTLRRHCAAQGMRLIESRQALRREATLRLLATELGLADVATALGFSSSQTLARFVRGEFDLTATELRRRLCAWRPAELRAADPSAPPVGDRETTAVRLILSALAELAGLATSGRQCHVTEAAPAPTLCPIALPDGRLQKGVVMADQEIVKQNHSNIEGLEELAELDLFAEELPERLNALAPNTAFTASTASSFTGTLGSASSVSTLSCA